MVDTSYNPDFAPYVRSSLRQAPIPATTHNLPASIAANSSAQSSLIVTEGFSLIACGITSSQNGTLSIQRYVDAGGTVAQGAAVSASLTATTAANLNVTDGLPFASFKITVTNSAGSSAALSNIALLVQMGENTASGGSGGGANAATDGSTTITTGGTAQNLFSSTVPTNGYSLFNPDTANELWVSDSTTATANAAGSIRVGPLGYYATEPGQKPIQAVSVYGAVTGQKITTRRW